MTVPTPEQDAKMARQRASDYASRLYGYKSTVLRAEASDG